MRIKLVREARIRHKAGDIVEVSPAEAMHLLTLRLGVKAEEAGTEAEQKKPARKKKES